MNAIYRRVFINFRNNINETESEVKDIINILESSRFEVVFNDRLDSVNKTEFDFALSIGGDGTFLETANIFYETSVPIFGINFGHVGFLADASAKNAKDAVSKLIKGEFIKDGRNILVGETSMNNQTISKFWALNEIAIEKAGEKNRFGMINLKVEVDSNPFSSYGCDGLIVSTSTGSTAHSFSAGGPVVSPEVNAMILVPIAAHTLFSRPVVFGSSSQLEIEFVNSPAEFACLVCDGSRSIKIETRTKIKLTQKPNGVYIARLNDSLNKQPFTNKLVEKFKLPVESWKNA